MLVLDDRYVVQGPTAAYDLLLQRPVALVRLPGLPPLWQGEHVARRLRLALDPRRHGWDVGVAGDGLYVVLPAPRPAAEPLVGRSPDRVTDAAEPPSATRTALIAALGVLSALTAAMASDGLVG